MPTSLRRSPSGELVLLDTSSIENVSTAPGDTMSDVFNALFPANGQASQTIVQDGVPLTIVPPGSLFVIDIWGGGASAAGGSRLSPTSMANGASGSGGGAHRRAILSRAELSLMLIRYGGAIPVEVAALVLGGAGRTGSNGGGDPGTAGGRSRFGDFYAFGGGVSPTGNSGGQQGSGSGAGTMGPGLPGQATSNIVAAGGPPGPSQAVYTTIGGNSFTYGCPGDGGGSGGTSTSNTLTGGVSRNGGGGGGVGGTNTTGVNGANGGNSLTGGGGGGGGGGSSNIPSFGAGGIGGGHGSPITGNGFNGGGAAGGITNGASASNGADQRSFEEGGEGGGGGAAGLSSGNAGNGGNGGFPAGGGGGGGSSQFGNGGRGGNGAAGSVVIRGFY